MAPRRGRAGRAVVSGRNAPCALRLHPVPAHLRTRLERGEIVQRSRPRAVVLRLGARRQQPGGARPVAESLLGRVDADRAADALERARGVGRKRSFPHFARHTGAAAAVAEPAGRAQRPVRQRRARLAAVGAARPAVRQRRAGALLCDTLFDDLYFRPRANGSNTSQCGPSPSSRRWPCRCSS